MKNFKRIVSFLLLSLFIGNIAFASFPVDNKNSKNVKKTELVQKIDKTLKKELKKNEGTTTLPASNDTTDLIITLLLWFFLGAFAAHRWYKRKPVGLSILMILLFLLGILIPLLGLIFLLAWTIWMIIDLIKILTGNF